MVQFSLHHQHNYGICIARILFASRTLSSQQACCAIKCSFHYVLFHHFSCFVEPIPHNPLLTIITGKPSQSLFIVLARTIIRNRCCSLKCLKSWRSGCSVLVTISIFRLLIFRLNSEKMTPLVGMVGLALYPSILSENMSSRARHHRSG